MDCERQSRLKPVLKDRVDGYPTYLYLQICYYPYSFLTVVPFQVGVVLNSPQPTETTQQAMILCVQLQEQANPLSRGKLAWIDIPCIHVSESGLLHCDMVS